MNTRQKLTLGIAAIFMVTLTIVGVTYAYFVTRVEGLDTDVDATVTTATLARVEYAEGNDTVKLADALPGENVYKTFKVQNMNPDNAAQYDVVLSASDVEGEVKFVYSTNGAETDGCYVTGIDSLTLKTEIEALRTEKATLCYKAGNNYDSVKYYLYDVTSKLGEDKDTAFDALEGENKQNEIKALVTETVTPEEGEPYTQFVSTEVTGQVKNGTTKETPQPLANGEVIEADETRYYVLRIEYAESNLNQNIENDAVLNMFVSIK